MTNYKELTDQAYTLHQQNKFDDAEKLYKMLLDISPQDANVLNLYGLLCLSKKDYETAISLLSRAVIYSKSRYVITNLAKAYLSNKNYDNAIRLFKESINIEPTDDALYSLAIAYKKINQPDKAAECYKTTLKINPNHYNACYNLMIIYRDKELYDNAIQCANHCLEIRPNTEEIFAVLSFIYERKRDFKSAIKTLESAANINPKETVYYYNLGVLYSIVKDIENSTKNYLKVLFFEPENIKSLVNLCTLYKDKNPEQALIYISRAKEIAPNEKNVLLNLSQVYKNMCNNLESIEVANKILEIYPESHEAYSILGSNYMDLFEYNKALEFYTKACDLSPDNTIYQHGKAIALKYLGKTDEAEKILEKVIENKPNASETKIALGMLYLYKKEFYKGMELYRPRNNDTIVNEKFKDKLWKPFDDLSGKRVLVYSNCGLGDTFMYARYLYPLKEIADSVILQTDKELTELFKFNFKDIEVISKAQVPSKDYDVVLPVMDMGYALKLDFSNIPLSSGYIKADPELSSKLASIPEFQNENTKVGLFWQGNKRILKNRSIKFDLLSDLLNNSNIQFYSLQINQDMKECPNIIEIKKYVHNFNDTAAIISNLDLVITIDSSIAHISGAMGKKTYLMLPKVPEWRWFDDDKTTPWYDSVTIFKQKEPKNWDSVINEIKLKLDEQC